jgi:hypothetical protein
MKWANFPSLAKIARHDDKHNQTDVHILTPNQELTFHKERK